MDALPAQKLPKPLQLEFTDSRFNEMNAPRFERARAANGQEIMLLAADNTAQRPVAQGAPRHTLPTVDTNGLSFASISVVDAKNELVALLNAKASADKIAVKLREVTTGIAGHSTVISELGTSTATQPKVVFLSGFSTDPQSAAAFTTVLKTLYGADNVALVNRLFRERQALRDKHIASGQAAVTAELKKWGAEQRKSFSDPAAVEFTWNGMSWYDRSGVGNRRVDEKFHDIFEKTSKTARHGY